MLFPGYHAAHKDRLSKSVLHQSPAHHEFGRATGPNRRASRSTFLFQCVVGSFAYNSVGPNVAIYRLGIRRSYPTGLSECSGFLNARACDCSAKSDRAGMSRDSNWFGPHRTDRFTLSVLKILPRLPNAAANLKIDSSLMGGSASDAKRQKSDSSNPSSRLESHEGMLRLRCRLHRFLHLSETGSYPAG